MGGVQRKATLNSGILHLNVPFQPVVLIVLNALASTAAWSQSAKPTVTAVANVASYANGSISPGEMVVIFGSGMGPSNVVGFQLDQQGRIANTLSQVQVLFDGNPAPLIYVSAKQISAMVPYGVTGKSSTQIQVVYQGSTSGSFQKPIAPSAPGIFTADSSGQGQGAMTNSDGSYNTSSNPATPGSYVTFYLTGEGQTDPSGSDGNIATSTANVALLVTVQIAGRTVPLLYAGSAPGNVNGFAQINAVIPADLPYGGNLPLVVKIGGVASQSGVTLVVSGPPAPIPGAPQSLSASSSASGQIVLTWTPADGLAARFHVERQIAGAGAFTEIAVAPVPATTFTDTGVTAGISYQYRVRAENDYGFSAYSPVATGTVVPVAPLTPPSNVQAVPASQTQINLTWSAANTNATKFHIERKSGATGAYAEITAVPSAATSYQDTTVQPNTAYTYRMRSEGATGGLSAYSSETSATTPALPLPPAPTLQGTATSSSQVHLSWSTTATGIVLFGVERRTTTGGYLQISQPTATSTSFDDSGLSGSTTYLYRMRVQTGAGFSPYSNEVTVTTLQAPPAAPTNLQATSSSSQVNLTWTNNAPNATAIRVESQPAGSASFTDIGAAVTLTGNGDIVLIGHSMGGLLARDMMLNNRNQVLANHRVRALVTLGTPNVGYPYVAGLDDFLARAGGVTLCPNLGAEMGSDYRTQQAQNVVIESTYLLGLNQRWGATPISGGLQAWLAASGTFCKDPTRSVLNPVGCPNNSPSSDGVVCDQSARFLLNVPANIPTSTWSSDFYAHTSSLGTRYVNGLTLLCTTQSQSPIYIPLYDPPASSALIAAIRSLLNGIH
jgi:uncharacterized protein (TIGR03437 family)